MTGRSRLRRRLETIKQKALWLLEAIDNNDFGVAEVERAFEQRAGSVYDHIEAIKMEAEAALDKLK